MALLNQQPEDDNFNDLLGNQSSPFVDPFPAIPAELKALKRWCVYGADKVPYNARSHQPGNPIMEADQSTYQEALDALAADLKFKGVGFGLQYSDGYTCVDFDHCIQNGVIDPEVVEILNTTCSFCELSPSERGVHLWIKGWQVPDVKTQGIKVGSKEIYSGRHYLTCTGKVLSGAPTTIETRDLTDFYERLRKSSVEKTDVAVGSNSSTVSKPSVQIEQGGKALTTKIALLSEGAITSQKPFVIEDDFDNRLEYGSHSEADQALVNLLYEKFEGDEDKVCEAFEASSLSRDKWTERADYRASTLKKSAIVYEKSQVAKTAPVVPATQVSSAPEAIDWRKQFCSVGQLKSGGTTMLVDGFLPEGVSMIGALPGNCKTLFALSLAKALTTGKPFLGRFEVPAIIPVLYLIPESGGGPFRVRCEKFGIPDNRDLFLCRTVSQGGTLLMDDLAVKAAVIALKPLVILDTAIRFNKSTDENSATANKLFVDDAIALIDAGARGVLGLHHATKSSRKDGLTLESALRGTGDLAAMADSVYGLMRNDTLYDSGRGPLELEVLCLKPRDFEPPEPFTIAATAKVDDEIISHIDTKGDFVVLEVSDLIQDLNSRFVQAVTKEPDLSFVEVAELLGVSKPRVQRIAKKVGFRKAETGWRPAVSPATVLTEPAKEVPY